MNNFFYYITFGNHFDFLIAVYFAVIIFFIRVSKLFDVVQFAPIYYLFYFLLGYFYVIELDSKHLAGTWLGTATYFIEFTVVKILVVFFWFILLVYINNYFHQEYMQKGQEKILCIDLAFCGAILFVSAADMLEMFLGLELIAFPSYALIALDKTKASSEASLKYFIYSVYGSLLFVISFILLFISSGQISFNEIAYFVDSPKFEVAAALWATTFFIKLGIGPFFYWAPPVYQAVSPVTFVFVSTVTKVPLLLPILYLSRSYFFVTHSWVFYYVVILLIWGCFLAARDLFGETNIRRIIAYTSTINFSIAVTALVFNIYNVKLFLCFTIMYLLSNFAVYLSHSLLNTDKFGKNEVVNLKNFNRENPIALVMLNTSLIFSSGLPPLTMFLFKLITIGSISFMGQETINFFNLGIAGFVTMCSVSSYAAYFSILKNINYAKPNQVPALVAKIEEKDFSRYSLAVVILLFSVVAFYISIQIL
jgi:NADH-quinone oxidoreductase subunit N